MLQHRMRCAWGKFSQFRRALIDKHVDLRLRLRLFDAVVTPTAMYGLSVAPLTVADKNYLAATQRKMLRRIVGYKKAPDDTWADMYRQIRTKLQNALQCKPIRDWNEQLQLQKQRLHGDTSGLTRNPLTCRASSWNPSDIRDEDSTSRPARGRGRPRTSWNNR